MKDLCEATGLERQAIHFYISEGLVPPGQKTGRNTAFYSEKHIARLNLIKRLQDERFLPLKAIRSVLTDVDDPSFSDSQRAFLANLRTELRIDTTPTQTPLAEMCERAGLPLTEGKQLIEQGLARGTMGEEPHIDTRDRWTVECLAQLRSLGFKTERGFGVPELSFFHNTIRDLFEREMELITRGLAGEDPEKVARMIEGALPIIHQVLAQAHARFVQEFVEGTPSSKASREKEIV